LFLIDASSVAHEILGRPITNTAMLGAFTGISGVTSLESVLAGLGSFLNGPLLEKNIEVIKRTFKLSRKENKE